MLRQDKVPRCFALSETGEPCRGWPMGHEGSMLCTVHTTQYNRRRITLGELLEIAGLCNSVEFNDVVHRSFLHGVVMQDIVNKAYGGDRLQAEKIMGDLTAIKNLYQAWFKAMCRKANLRPDITQLVALLEEQPCGMDVGVLAIESQTATLAIKAGEHQEGDDCGGTGELRSERVFFSA